MATSTATAPRAPTTFGLILAVFLGVLILESASFQLRHLKYGLPIAALLLVGASRAPDRLHAEVQRFLRGMLCLVLVSLTVSLMATSGNEALTSRCLEETFFIAAPIVTAYLMFLRFPVGTTDFYSRWMFVGVFLAYFVERNSAILATLLHPSKFVVQFVTSVADAESNLSFVFAIFCLFFAMRGDRRRALVAFALTVLSFKRIAIGGAVLMIAVYYVARRLRLMPERSPRAFALAMVSLNVALFGLLYILSQGYFEDAIRSRTGLSTNWLTMGRSNIYALVFSHGGVPLLGRGLGSLWLLLREYRVPIENPHSDVIKFALEVGPVVSCVFVYYLYKFSARSLQTFVMTGFMNILFISDNVSIYVPVMLSYYAVQGFLLSRDESTLT